MAALGALSGLLASLSIMLLQDAAEFTPLEGIEFSPASLAPGLVFGALIGFWLRRRGLIGPAGWGFYVVASAGCYWLAFTLAREVFFSRFGQDLIVTGLAAGFCGSACLTGISAAAFGRLRRTLPCFLSVLAGCLLGGLLPIAVEGEGFWPVALFFALWQAGYAAALSPALSPAGAPSDPT